MNILPKNEIKPTVDTPHNFFIYGATMSGKSYLAGEFPNPLFIDTDGNASANPYPSIEVRNIKSKSGDIVNSVVDQLSDIILELQTTNHGFETVVLDVIDDISIMIEQYICNKNKVEALSDIAYGKGYNLFNTIFNQLVIDLKTLPINVIYISRMNTKIDNNVSYEVPSLPEKKVNIVNGNCDYMIQTQKIGKNHIRSVKAKRKNYEREKIDDKRILKILDTVTGAFERSHPISKAKQDEIVKELDKKQEQSFISDNKEQPRKKPQI